jgi:TctA family transporter
MDPVAAFAMLMAQFAVTTTAHNITAVHIGVPGTAAAAATVLDGYPMAKKGQAARALGAAFTCSAIGGVLGAVVLGLSLPVVRPLIF